MEIISSVRIAQLERLLECEAAVAKEVGSDLQRLTFAKLQVRIGEIDALLAHAGAGNQAQWLTDTTRTLRTLGGRLARPVAVDVLSNELTALENGVTQGRVPTSTMASRLKGMRTRAPLTPRQHRLVADLPENLQQAFIEAALERYPQAVSALSAEFHHAEESATYFASRGSKPRSLTPLIRKLRNSAEHLPATMLETVDRKALRNFIRSTQEVTSLMAERERLQHAQAVRARFFEQAEYGEFKAIITVWELPALAVRRKLDAADQAVAAVEPHLAGSSVPALLDRHRQLREELDDYRYDSFEEQLANSRVPRRGRFDIEEHIADLEDELIEAAENLGEQAAFDIARPAIDAAASTLKARFFNTRSTKEKRLQATIDIVEAMLPRMIDAAGAAPANRDIEIIGQSMNFKEAFARGFERKRTELHTAFADTYRVGKQQTLTPARARRQVRSGLRRLSRLQPAWIGEDRGKYLPKVPLIDRVREQAHEIALYAELTQVTNAVNARAAVLCGSIDKPTVRQAVAIEAALLAQVDEVPVATPAITQTPEPVREAAIEPVKMLENGPPTVPLQSIDR